MEQMRLSDHGRVADDEWRKTSMIRPGVVVRPAEFVVMPDHIHGIIRIAFNSGRPTRGGNRRGGGNIRPRGAAALGP